MRARIGCSIAVQVLLGVLTTLSMSAAAAEAEGKPSGSAVFATVGDTVITAEEFEANVHAGVRGRFYHGKVPSHERRAFRREVGQALIDRILLQQEARRRGLRPDEGWVAERMTEVEARMASNPGWKQARQNALPGLRAQLAGDSLILQLREAVQDVPPPDEDELRRFYKENTDKFTTPERIRVSMILLRVEPWAPAAKWEAARDEAGRLLDKLRQGAEFADLARLHSGDPSGRQGGDLGYIHKGMLAEEAQRVLDDLRPGELSAPVRLLRGVALFRLEDRQAPVLNELADVEQRARGLLLRRKKEKAWERVLAGLREDTPIEINEALLSAAD